MSDETATGGTAFPTKYGDPGMTLRDYLAAAALTAVMLTNTHRKPEQHAAVAYEIADAMLAEREPKTH